MRSAGRSSSGRNLSSLSALGAALATVGLLFAIFWQPAHEPYPHAFGRVVALIGVAVGVQAIVVGTALRDDPAWRWSLDYGRVTAATCAAVALAAFSRRIIAEGQLTAMLLAVGFLFTGVIASLVDEAMLAAGIRRDLVRRACGIGTLVLLAVLLAWRFPVVQLLDPARADAIHPVHGSLYAYLAGVAVGLCSTEIGRRGGTPFVAVAFLTSIIVGFLFQSWFGAAVATIGISVALALGDCRQTVKKP